MTNNQLTKEWLQGRIANMECYGVVGDEALILQVYRIALAAMDSEPVASNYRKLFTCTGCGAEGLDEPLETNCHCCVDGAHWVESRLYRHAQPASASEPVGYFRRYDPDAETLISQCSKNADDSFPLYTHAQPEPITVDVERDAQRYRFLRDKDAFGDDGEPGLATWDDLIELDMNEFDAAIDARMAHPSVDFLALDNALQKHERRRCKDRNCNKQIFGYSVDGLCEDCYTAVYQQPAPVVPEEKPMPNTLSMYAVDAVAAIAEVRGWNAYRAAMLQAEPVTTANKLGNSPAIPDTWITVSERMPEVGVKVLCFPVEDEPIHASFNGQLWLQDISWSVSDEIIDNVISCNVTHWMPLPDAPQEVKP